jgi:hypothetical protein
MALRVTVSPSADFGAVAVMEEAPVADPPCDQLLRLGQVLDDERPKALTKRFLGLARELQQPLLELGVGPPGNLSALHRVEELSGPCTAGRQGSEGLQCLFHSRPRAGG